MTTYIKLFSQPKASDVRVFIHACCVNLSCYYPSVLELFSTSKLGSKWQNYIYIPRSEIVWFPNRFRSRRHIQTTKSKHHKFCGTTETQKKANSTVLQTHGMVTSSKSLRNGQCHDLPPCQLHLLRPGQG